MHMQGRQSPAAPPGMRPMQVLPAGQGEAGVSSPGFLPRLDGGIAPGVVGMGHFASGLAPLYMAAAGAAPTPNQMPPLNPALLPQPSGLLASPVAFMPPQFGGVLPFPQFSATGPTGTGGSAVASITPGVPSIPLPLNPPQGKHQGHQQPHRSHHHRSGGGGRLGTHVNDGGPGGSGSLGSRGPTLYLGHLTPDTDDSVIRHLLQECGRVIRWSRSVNPVSKQPSTFGFCEFESPLGVIRAISFLHSLQLDGQSLVANCEDKLRDGLEKWKKERRMRMHEENPSKSMKEIDADIAKEDNAVQQSIRKIVTEWTAKRTKRLERLEEASANMAAATTADENDTAAASEVPNNSGESPIGPASVSESQLVSEKPQSASMSGSNVAATHSGSASNSVAPAAKSTTAQGPPALDLESLQPGLIDIPSNELNALLYRESERIRRWNNRIRNNRIELRRQIPILQRREESRLQKRRQQLRSDSPDVSEVDSSMKKRLIAYDTREDVPYYLSANGVVREVPQPSRRRREQRIEELEAERLWDDNDREQEARESAASAGRVATSSRRDNEPVGGPDGQAGAKDFMTGSKETHSEIAAAVGDESLAELEPGNLCPPASSGSSQRVVKEVGGNDGVDRKMSSDSGTASEEDLSEGTSNRVTRRKNGGGEGELLPKSKTSMGEPPGGNCSEASTSSTVTWTAVSVAADNETRKVVSNVMADIAGDQNFLLAAPTSSLSSKKASGTRIGHPSIIWDDSPNMDLVVPSTSQGASDTGASSDAGVAGSHSHGGGASISFSLGSRKTLIGEDTNNPDAATSLPFELGDSSDATANHVSSVQSTQLPIPSKSAHGLILAGHAAAAGLRGVEPSLVSTAVPVQRSIANVFGEDEDYPLVTGGYSLAGSKLLVSEPSHAGGGKSSEPTSSVPTSFVTNTTQAPNTSKTSSSGSTVCPRSQQGPSSNAEFVTRVAALVPKDKQSLYNFPIDWATLAANKIFEQKVNTWVSKKVADLLGEQEPELSELITTKITTEPSPQSFLAMVTEFFEDDAEAFVVKLWRLLVFESLRLTSQQSIS